MTHDALSGPLLSTPTCLSVLDKHFLTTSPSKARLSSVDKCSEKYLASRVCPCGMGINSMHLRVSARITAVAAGMHTCLLTSNTNLIVMAKKNKKRTP